MRDVDRCSKSVKTFTAIFDNMIVMVSPLAMHVVSTPYTESVGEVTYIQQWFQVTLTPSI